MVLVPSRRYQYLLPGLKTRIEDGLQSGLHVAAAKWTMKSWIAVGGDQIYVYFGSHSQAKNQGTSSSFEPSSCIGLSQDNPKK